MAAPGRPSGGEFVELPEMTPILCKIASADLEMGKPYTDPKTGKVSEPRQQVKIILDALSYTDDEGETVELEDARMWVYAGFSLHEKSKLRPIAAAVMPEGTTEDELFEQFDTDMLVGKKLIVFGKYKEGDADRQYLKFVGCKRVGAKKAGAKAETKPAEKVKAKPAAEPESDDIDI